MVAFLHVCTHACVNDICVHGLRARVHACMRACVGVRVCAGVRACVGVCGDAAFIGPKRGADYTGAGIYITIYIYLVDARLSERVGSAAESPASSPHRGCSGHRGASDCTCAIR